MFEWRGRHGVIIIYSMSADIQNVPKKWNPGFNFAISSIDEHRWGGRHNLTFMHHKFLVATVKKWLKLVYIYGSCRKIKKGCSLSRRYTVYSPSVHYMSTCMLVIVTVYNYYGQITFNLIYVADYWAVLKRQSRGGPVSPAGPGPPRGLRRLWP